MKRILIVVFVLALALPVIAFAQNSNQTANTNAAKKRAPIFRATSDQIKQAQAILKQRGFYAGEQTGKLDADTRAGLKKYQEAEKLKVTGTLNKITLEKMGITLTESQKKM
jgi:peptidoglycan hydrolase-like protein with peptidoglycan-binding domain